ncbi:MAG: hypothetical protein IT462_18070 [Planctomycetes bacterium]|nr:hypothetical protein [Planctomycetota bacterium]
MKFAMISAAMVVAVLCGAGCSEQDGCGNAGDSTSEGVLGGDAVAVPRAIAVRRNFTPVIDGGTYDLGARGWTVEGPLVDFQIENPGSTPLTLTGSPQAVTVSALVNVSGVTISQPTVVNIPPNGATSFGLVPLSGRRLMAAARVFPASDSLFSPGVLDYHWIR